MCLDPSEFLMRTLIFREINKRKQNNLITYILYIYTWNIIYMRDIKEK